MNTKNSLVIFKSFPKLYRGRAKPLTESLMGFGFDCKDGWFQLIWDLSAAIERQAAAEGRADQEWPEVVQVKEKFGMLSYYMAGATKEIWKIVREAESKSTQTCEICGAPGKLYTGGWWHTACPEHARGQDKVPPPV